MTKLRYGLVAMLILLTVFLASSYFITSTEEEVAINALEKLDYNELDAIIKYSDMPVCSDVLSPPFPFLQ